MVIGHTDCGMANVDFERLRKAMEEKGVPPDFIEELGLEDWILAIRMRKKMLLKVSGPSRNSGQSPMIYLSMG